MSDSVLYLCECQYSSSACWKVSVDVIDRKEFGKMFQRGTE